MDAMRSPVITALEFAEAYAARSGMTLTELASARPNGEVRECDCDFEDCAGWQLVPADARMPWETPGVLLVDLVLADR